METSAIQELSGALAAAFGALSPNQLLPISRRDMLRCLLYGSYFLSLVDPATAGVPAAQLPQLAAENALLHFVLPTLPVERFGSAVNALLDGPYSLTETAVSDDALGGLLKSRLVRLHEATDSTLGFGDTVDFWSALS
jgi:hypothetical protein